eukprot:1150484-Pelagomonas_calceolata.AAC.1
MSFRDLCKIISGKAVTSHTTLLGVGGTCYNECTIVKKIGLDYQQASKLTSELHAHSAEYAHKPVLQVVTPGRPIENKNTPHSQALEPGDPSNPPDPH